MEHNKDNAASPSSQSYFPNTSWAIRTTLAALQGLHESYLERDREPFFFLGLELLESSDSKRREEIATQLEMTSNSLTVSLKRLRERLANQLREIVSGTLYQPTAEEVDAELHTLLESLPQNLDFSTLAKELSLES